MIVGKNFFINNFGSVFVLKGVINSVNVKVMGVKFVKLVIGIFI